MIGACGLKRSCVLAALSAYLVASMPASLHADFRHGRMGPRPRAMGSAFVAIADDANAIYWNPAGMVRMEGLELTGARTAIWQVEGLSLDYMAAAWSGAGFLAFGASWVRLDLEDIYYENTINIGMAAEIPMIEGLSAGFALKFYTLAAPGYEQYNDPAYEGRVTRPSADFGLLYRMPDRPLTFGAVVYNVNEPKLKLLSTTKTPDPVYRDFAVGVSYLFSEMLLLTYDVKTRYGEPGDLTGRFGSEIWFFDVVVLRGGFERENLTAGLGLRDRHWQIDLMLETHYDLGNTYQFGMTLRF